MTQQLPAFFETMLPFLMGELTPGDVTALLGQCPSGEERLALYQTLIRRERAGVLRSLFPATRRLAKRVAPGAWEELEREHLARYRSTCWEPNRVGESFPGLVEESSVENPELAVLAEVADHEWIRFLVTLDGGGDVHFRAYDHDVARYVEIGRAHV